MKYIYYATIGLVVAFIVFSILLNNGQILGIDKVGHMFEWITRFILPWIALYWFIRFVKGRK